MILQKVQIRDFKCIKDSGTFRLDRVTCLVGKNESGKTAILEALDNLNPLSDSDGEFDQLDYPRQKWLEYKSRDKNDPVDAIMSVWELEPQDVEQLEAVFGEACFTSKEVILYKGYYPGARWEYQINEVKMLNHCLKATAVAAESIKDWPQLSTVKALMEFLEGKKDIAEAETLVLAAMKKLFPKKDARAAVDRMLNQLLPKMVYFDEYLELPGQVALTDFETRQQSLEQKQRAKDAVDKKHEVFKALLGMIGATASQLKDIKQYERLKAELEAASVGISKKVFEYWTQNRHLKVLFSFDEAMQADPPPLNSGKVLRLRIENTRHGASVSFDKRSAGFVWFFSFLVWFFKQDVTIRTSSSFCWMSLG